MSPFRFLVPSMLNRGLGLWSRVIGVLIRYARSSLMKFSVAPESSRDSTSALLDAVCIYALIVIDFLSDKYTRSSVPLLIQAAQIRAFKNPIPLFPRLVLRSYGVAVLCLPGRGPRLLPEGPLLDRLFGPAPSVVVGCRRPSLPVFVPPVLLVTSHSLPLLVLVDGILWRSALLVHS
jgi:hypothetical protein